VAQEVEHKGEALSSIPNSVFRNKNQFLLDQGELGYGSGGGECLFWSQSSSGNQHSGVFFAKILDGLCFIHEGICFLL
jgi:hypothetical protein